MNHAIERAFELLLGLRQYSGSHSDQLYSSVQGFIDGLFWSDVLTADQYRLLGYLASNAFCNITYSFPPKLQAQAVNHAEPEQVFTPAASSRLPMQRVLVAPYHVLRTLFGEPVTRSIRQTFARLHPSWAPVSARWPLALSGSQMCLSLGATKAPSPILERDLQRQKRAVRAFLRSVRTEVTC